MNVRGKKQRMDVRLQSRGSGSMLRQSFLAFLAGATLIVGSAASAGAVSILYFEDYAVGTSAVPGALASLGLTGSTTTAADVTDFNTQLGSGTWDLVILGEQNGNLFPAVGANMTAYITGGGHVLAATWLADVGALGALLEASPVDVNGSTITTDGHPIFAGLPAMISLTNPGWGVFSRSWTPTGSAAAAGTLGAGSAVIVGHSGRTILVGPIFDTFTTLAEGETFVANAIGLLLGAPLDHYLSYKIKGTSGAPKFLKFGPIVLADQFGSAKYDIVKPQHLGLPADKNAEGVLDPATHLEEYKIVAVKATPKFIEIPDVRIENQCNDMLIEVKKPVSLLVPTNKDLSNPVTPPIAPDRDHFLCYKVGRQSKAGDIKLPRFPKGIQVDVTDQFQVNRRYDLKKITKLCVPVDKSVDAMDPPLLLAGANKGMPKPITPAAIQSPNEHLVCYQAKPAKKLIPQTGCGPTTPGDTGTIIVPAQAKHVSVPGFHVNNQFGPEQHDSVKEVELCIPSEKQLPICGDNEVNYPTEECDGTDDGACPGTCDLACTCQQFSPVTEDLGACSGAAIDTWTFEVLKGAPVTVAADTTAAPTAADLCLFGSCPGNVSFGADDNVACTFPPPTFQCPSTSFTASKDGTCTVTVSTCSSNCADPNLANYQLTVDVNGVPARILLGSDQ